VEGIVNRLSNIGTLLKKIYRSYSGLMLERLQGKGFTDLRPSFLEVLLAICDHETPSIKDIGLAVGLKKQTMTSHLNELEKRGYVIRQTNPRDKREQLIVLTDYGQRFKLSLLECADDVERLYTQTLGEVELSRVEHLLQNFFDKSDGLSKENSEGFLL
jgi:DNA-binding MarR family transcriptional regulator